MKIKIRIDYDEASDFYLAQCLNFYDLASQGDSEEDALENLQLAIQDYLEENEIELATKIQYEIIS